MVVYHELFRLVLEKGNAKGDRTGTLSVFGAQARLDLREKFPLLTTKKLHLKSIIYESLWFSPLLRRQWAQYLQPRPERRKCRKCKRYQSRSRLQQGWSGLQGRMPAL